MSDEIERLERELTRALENGDLLLAILLDDRLGRAMRNREKQKTTVSARAVILAVIALGAAALTATWNILSL